MTLREVASELPAEVLCGEDEALDSQLSTVASGDLMSDILARLGTPDMLLTGLVTSQMIRTCSVSSIRSVMVVRGKQVRDDLVKLAQEEDIVLMVTNKSMFAASGLLYSMGLRSGVETD